MKAQAPVTLPPGSETPGSRERSHLLEHVIPSSHLPSPGRLLLKEGRDACAGHQLVPALRVPVSNAADKQTDASATACKGHGDLGLHRSGDEGLGHPTSQTT